MDLTVIAVTLAGGVLAAGWAWRRSRFSRAGLIRRLNRASTWEQFLAGRDHATFTVFGPIADEAIAAARRLGYVVTERRDTDAATTFVVSGRSR